MVRWLRGSMALKNSLPRSVWPQVCWQVVQVAAISLFTLLGLYLRYTYARNSSPYIDEYTTMWVAKRTVQHGLPVFSTGALYSQGLLFTYLDATFFYVLGFSEWIARLPSLLLSAAYIPLSYWVGKRILSARPAILTCALIALDPQSIGWGGRARSYSLLIFLVLLVVYFLYRGVVREDRGAYRRLALLLFLGAVFAHNEAILLYPAILAIALLWRGWRWFLRWDVLVENVVVIGGMGFSFYLYRLMQPAGWSEVGQGRGEVTLTVDVVHAWERLKPFFLGPDQLPFVGVLTFLLLAGIGYCLVRCVREGPRRLFDPLDRDAGLFYLSVLFVLVVLEMVFLVSEGRLGTRYLFFLGPVFFLISSAVGFRFLEFLGGICERTRMGIPLTWGRPILTESLIMAAVLILVT
ncbi:MAG TPA: hypothetical protein ENO24_04705, partial [Chloroflexi bacterium]|nr:hypothetical protein [Chloroflexota bacterium]